MARAGNLAKLVKMIVDEMEAKGIFDTCLNCVHWHETKEICTKFNERPPAEVIIHGCEHHDVIPF